MKNLTTEVHEEPGYSLVAVSCPDQSPVIIGTRRVPTLVPQIVGGLWGATAGLFYRLWTNTSVTSLPPLPGSVFGVPTQTGVVPKVEIPTTEHHRFRHSALD